MCGLQKAIRAKLSERSELVSVGLLRAVERKERKAVLNFGSLLQGIEHNKIQKDGSHEDMPKFSSLLEHANIAAVIFCELYVCN